MRDDLPTGTVTFLFTDVEGSTRLLRELGAGAYAEALADHRRILREAFASHGGVEVDTQGDAFFVAFPTAPEAVQAAAEATEGLASAPIRVRIGVHTGTPHLTDEGYVGLDVHKAAWIAACGHGGQVLVSAATAALYGANDLRDLGEHRLRDLPGSERIYQLGEADFPPLKTLYRTNLPVPATPFLGREHELAEVRELLVAEDVRLLTLTGPGGTGKTRLALQSASEASERYPDGVFWVTLAPLRDPELVLVTAAQALGARDGLADHIGDKRLLLLFDNFEHVVEAATGLSELLRSCPKLDLLVTSREPLRLEGEWEYAVDPMREADSVKLFEARARAAWGDFQPDREVSEICARLDNLPLAIELAAARVRMLPPAALLERLDRRLPVLEGGPRDAPERQRTLSSTIEWSYELLSEGERRLFARVAVFAGGFTFDAAEDVCDAQLETLSSLIDKSLVRRSDDRFWMLETIREFAAERLDESEEADAVGRRHVECFLALVEEAEPDLRTPAMGPAEWVERLDREHENIRSALDRLEGMAETQLALRLAGAVWWFWDTRNHVAEGRRRLEGLLRADEQPTTPRAKGLIGASAMAMSAGDVAAARGWAEQALRLNRELRDPWGIAWTTCLLGWAIQDAGDFEAARPLLVESVRLLRGLGPDSFSLWATHLLAWNHFGVGERERARELWEENLAHARITGDRHIEALSLGALADNFARDEGRVEDALSMLTEAYRIHRDLDMPAQQAAFDLHRFASGLAAAGKPVAAARVLASAETVLEENDARVRPVIAEGIDQTIRAIRAQLDEPALGEAWAEGRALTPDEAVDLAVGMLD
jgi:predicted ATPase/class 3 adenylate cyclase